MLYYDKIDKSEGINLAKSNSTKEWMIYYYWLFYHGFEFHDGVCNGCHDLTMLCLNISDITITTDKNVNYRCIFIILTNVKQLIYQNIFFLKIVGIYEKILH